MKRLAPILLDFSQRYPEVMLDMDYSDRRVNLIEEGIDLSVRITRRLESGDVARKIGSSRMLVLAAPDYLARHGRPENPAELANHVCLGYTNAGSSQLWQFMVAGQLESFHVRSRLNANNGDVLTEATAQGLGISCQPDFIADSFLASGRVEEILANYPIPELGIYAMLPSNRHVPHRVRVLMDTLAEQLAAQ
jgi:DNA-binding transcriptional LysR family regulator